MPAPQSVLDRLDARFEWSLAELQRLARIPSVSAPGFDSAEVERAAEALAALLSDVGLEGVEVAPVSGGNPYVLGEWTRAGSGAPTVLLYAHYDVQPPGREDHWLTPPFEPTLRSDGRLYGRGVVDDKAGALLFASALRAWLEAEGRLPVNVKFVAEGEEEVGSLHLAEFLRARRERLQADVIALADTANLEAGLPCLTTSLRGLVSVELSVRALDHPIHSGMWGGPIPDAATAMGVLLGRLVDQRGQVAIPGFEADVPELSEPERAELRALPFDESSFRADAGVAPGVVLAGSDTASVYERLWRRPALSVTALEGMPLDQAANQLIPRTRARIGVRLAPGQSPERLRDLLVGVLARDPPWGVEVETRVEAAVPGWKTEPAGPAFDAARRALAAGFGREPVCIGCGGSIPFVGPFSEVLGGVPALMLGLEDPRCNAHGENESLHVEDFRSASRAAAHLLLELAESLPSP